jgi:hypothetical protein
VIAAVAATLALATPSRGALVERWLHANPSHSIAQLSSARRSTSATPPDLHALATRELSVAGRYRLAQPPRVVIAEPWWERAWEWIAERWDRFWHAIFSRVHVGRQQAASFGDVLLVIVALLLLFVAVRLIMGLQLVRAAKRGDSERLTEPPSPRALYKRACNAANAGDYAMATLLLFTATVSLLDRQGAVDLGPTATVGDFRRALRARNTALVPVFDAIAAPFVQTAYAERRIDEPQWEHARTAFDSLAVSSRPANVSS